jgi:opacity protein-like surface antigen
MKRLAFLALVLAASPALAQRTEVSALAGWASSDSLDRTAAGIQELQVAGGFTWGLQATRFFTPHLGAELSFSRQGSDLVISTASGSAELFDMSLGLLHGNAVYQFGAEDARLKPFVFAGVGATFFSSQGLESETKLSFGLGAGVKWFPRRSVGLRLQGRYDPTRLNDESSDFCDPFGFCQGSLQQFELSGGVVLRF